MLYDWVSAREQVSVEPAKRFAWTPVVVAMPRMQAVGLALRF
jgi:hypothetical protein